MRERVLTSAEAAARLGVSTTRVRQLADAGRLNATKTPLGRLIDADSVDQLVAERSEVAREVEKGGNELVL